MPFVVTLDVSEKWEELLQLTVRWDAFLPAAIRKDVLQKLRLQSRRVQMADERHVPPPHKRTQLFR